MGLYSLIKFGQKEHLEALRSDGLLYMKSLADFAKLESDIARGDGYEGTTHIIQPQHVGDLTLDLNARGRGKFAANPLDLAGPIRIGLNRTSECNVYCMFAITGPIDGELVDSRNLAFGDCFVLVLNVNEFLNRVARATSQARLDCSCGPVEYFDSADYSGEVGRFRKRSLFAHQREFRIVVEPGCDQPRKLLVGSLVDITSEVLPSEKVNQLLDFSTTSFRAAGLAERATKGLEPAC